jgi:hypothetical protein
MATGLSLPAETLARGRWKLRSWTLRTRRHLLQEAVTIPTAPKEPMVTALLPQAHIKQGRRL